MPIRRLAKGLDGRKVTVLLVSFVAIAALWGTIAVVPLKILVVLLHEISHGIAAVVTGGSIDRIEVNMNQGGICYTIGGSRFVVLTAGYLGSMLWGSLILVGASRTRWDRYLSGAIGLFLFIISALYIRNGFGLAFGLSFGTGMVLAGWKLSHDWNERILQVIGLTSCLYAILDIMDDVLRRPGIGSDADMLAEITLVPGFVWGVIWIILAAATSATALLYAAQKDE